MKGCAMRFATGLALLLTTSALLAAPTSPWRNMATKSDVQLIDHIDKQVNATLAIYADKALNEDDDQAYMDAAAFAKTTARPIKNKALLGNWSCRSTQISERFLVRYAFFNCQIKQKSGRLWFQKTSGSQRVSGYLYPDQGQQRVFIGGATVNNDPLRSYDLKQGDDLPLHEQYNAIGVLRVLSVNKMIMIQPNRHNLGYELYELVRKK